VPRNSGTGPSFAVVNLRASRSFVLTEGQTTRGGGKRAFGASEFTLAVQAQNLFNKTNLAAPVGNISSPLFGQSTAAAGDFGLGSNSAGTRRIEFSFSLSF
jgi:hypothetical protein